MKCLIGLERSTKGAVRVRTTVRVSSTIRVVWVVHGIVS